MLKHVIIFSIFLLSLNACACNLTDEYKSLRFEVYQDARQEYENCSNSVSNFYYWKAVAECEASGSGGSVKGGCAHTAGYKMGVDLEEKHKHCEVLKPSIDEVKALFSEVVKEKDIKKCNDK